MAGSDWGHQSWFQFESWRCHWRCTGEAEGPALVLLHGFGASSGHWRGNAEVLAAAGYRVYAMDLLEKALQLAAPQAVIEPAAGLIALAEAQQVHRVHVVARRSDGLSVIAPMPAAGAKAV